MKEAAVREFLRTEFYSLKFKIFIFSLMSILTSILEVAGIGLIFPFIYILMAPQAMHQFKLLSFMAKLFHLDTPRQLNLVLLCIIALLIFLKAAYTIFFRHMQIKVLTHYKTRLCDRLMRMYLYSDYAFHMKKSSSEIIKNIALAPLVYDQFIMSYFNLFISIVMCLGLCGLLFTVLPLNAVFALSIIAVAIYILNKGMKKHFVKLGKDTDLYYQKRQKIISQSLGAIRDTKILGRENFFANEYVNIQQSSFRNQHFYNFLSSLPPVIMEAWIMVSLMVVVLFHMYFNAYAQALATFGVLLAVLFRMLPQVNRILVSLQLINRSRDILESISSEFYLYEKNVYIPSKELEGKKLNFSASVTFTNASYCYPTKNEPAINRVNVTLLKNTFIGLTGPSGSGKTTFLNLLLGLIDPTDGTVCVDEHNLTDKKTKRLWQNNVGYVPQNLYIMEDSILNNIAFGIEKDKVDIDRAQKAAEMALLGDFIQEQPLGIHQVVGEAGSKISGGQRQRIGIARALYHNPEILVFDEVTNGLDVNLEYQLLHNLNQLKDTHTIIMITHKLNTLNLCDQILVFNQGNLIDHGDFKTLEQRCDMFKSLLKIANKQYGNSTTRVVEEVVG